MSTGLPITVEEMNDDVDFFDCITDRYSSRYHIENTSLDCWKRKNPEEWDTSEVLSWLNHLPTVDQDINIKLLHSERFNTLSGKRLIQMSVSDFQNLEPLYGVKIHNALQEVISKQPVAIKEEKLILEKLTPEDEKKAIMEILSLECSLNPSLLSTSGSISCPIPSEVSAMYTPTAIPNQSCPFFTMEATTTHDFTKQNTYTTSSSDYNQQTMKQQQQHKQPFSNNIYNGSINSSQNMHFQDTSFFDIPHTAADFVPDFDFAFNDHNLTSATSCSKSVPTTQAFFKDESAVKSERYCDMLPNRAPPEVSRYYGHQEEPYGVLNNSPNDQFSSDTNGFTSISSRSGYKCRERLWKFMRELLLDPTCNPSLVCWENREEGIFKFVQSETVARMWGQRKNNPNMTYEKMSRAMRYCKTSDFFAEVPKNKNYPKKLCFKFGPKAVGWR